MFVLDTNVISEMMKKDPDEKVASWIAGHDDSDLYTTVIAQAEIGYGIAKLMMCARKKALEDAFIVIFNQVFFERILPFDQKAAYAYSLIVADRQREGRPISVLDAQTAAICVAWKAILVTRNEKDFVSINQMSVINPWI